jgi:antitoxin HigA-1
MGMSVKLSSRLQTKKYIIGVDNFLMENIFESVKDRKIRPVHPGEIILDILEDLEVSQTQFAKTLGVSRRTVNQIIQGHRPITVDMAIRIGKALGNGPVLWLNLQQKVDVWDALQNHKEEYEKVLTVA